MQRTNDWYEDVSLGWDDHDDRMGHIGVTVLRTIKVDGYDYTYYQQVCSCGWRGEWCTSRVTAQMDQCENRHFGR